jgi:hypothetical protein
LKKKRKQKLLLESLMYSKKEARRSNLGMGPPPLMEINPWLALDLISETDKKSKKLLNGRSHLEL